jgi:uncharacterized cupin superfamily protein
MHEIIVDHSPDTERLAALGVASWPIWSCDVSQFPWSYDAKETCYLLEGKVVVTPDGAKPVTIKAGDLAVFPAGMSCQWNVLQSVRKHYRFE